MSPTDKPLAWLSGVLSSPPMPVAARIEAGFLLRMIQQGAPLGMPPARPMPSIGPGVLALRVTDGATRSEWRIVLKPEHDVVVVLHFFQKKTQKTPQSVVALCKQRLAAFSNARR
jgi:phage-related protein